MLENIYRLLYRDRRRLVFSGILVAIATIMGHDALPDPLPKLQIEIAAFGLIMLIMPLVAIYAPSYRYLLELGALSNLVFVVIGRAFPMSNFNPLSPDGSWISAAVLYVVTIFAVYYITNGKWSDYFKGPKRVVSKATVSTKLSARDVWFGLVPTPGHIDSCPDPDVVSIDYADRDKQTIRLITWMPGEPMGEVLLHLEKVEVFRQARLRIDVRKGKRDPTTEGTTTFTIEDLGTHRVLHVSHEMAQLPWRRALRGGLDDTLGRIMDIRLKAAEINLSDDLKLKGKQTLISPAEVMDSLCPAESGRGLRRRTDLDAFSLTRNEKGVEDRLNKPVWMGAMKG
ncbi:MAG: hypothetical protein ACRBCL_10395 [Maritimibacter sp.]